MSMVEHRHIKEFTETKVNLPAEQAQQHRDQVNALRARLKNKIDAEPSFSLVKMLHSGSVAKGTALRTVNDLDVAVYVRAADAPLGDPKLISWLAERLREANPHLEASQFEEQDHAVTVNFRGSGLNVDVVPVLYEGDPDDKGYLVRKNTGERVLTSISLHLDFIRRRKKSLGGALAELIRLTKWWKRMVTNRDPDFRFKSFLIELLWARLADDGVTLDDYPDAMERFFTYVVKSQLSEQIWFSDNYDKGDVPSRGSSPIEILDPVNPANNVAKRYDSNGRDRIVAAAHEALDAINEARWAPTKGRAVECWKVVLGPSFSP